MPSLDSSMKSVFILGIFTQRANAKGELVGIGVSTLLTRFVSCYTDINGYLYGVITCVVIGYLTSLLWPMAASHFEGNISLK